MCLLLTCQAGVLYSVLVGETRLANQRLLDAAIDRFRYVNPVGRVSAFFSDTDNFISALQAETIQFAVSEIPVTLEQLSVGISAFSLTVSAIAVIVNHPGVQAVPGYDLMISRADLSAIIAGNLSTWGQLAATQTNPSVASALNAAGSQQIRIVTKTQQMLPIVEQYLRKSDPAQWNFNGTLEWPTYGLARHTLTNSSLSEFTFVDATSYSIAFVEYDTYLQLHVSSDNVILSTLQNRLMQFVQLSTTSIEAVSGQLTYTITAGGRSLEADPSDLPVDQGYPMLGLENFIINFPFLDCSEITMLVSFVNFVLSNPAFRFDLAQMGYGPLSESLLANLYSRLALVECDARPLFSKLPYVGSGLGEVQTLVSRQAFGNIDTNFFVPQDEQELNILTRLQNRTIAYGRTLVAPLDPANSDYVAGTDLIVVPLAVLPASILSSVKDTLTDAPVRLRLDAQAIFDIFTGSISQWNHPTLQALNPTAALPASAINVMYPTTRSMTATILWQFLHRINPLSVPEAPLGDAILSPATFAGLNSPCETLAKCLAALSEDDVSNALLFGMESDLRSSPYRMVTYIAPDGTEVVMTMDAVGLAWPGHHFGETGVMDLTNLGDDGRWPFAAALSTLVPREWQGGNQNDAQMRELMAWLTWELLSPESQENMRLNRIAPVPADESEHSVGLLMEVTGKVAEAAHACYESSDSKQCSGNGECDLDEKKCICDKDYDGKFCQNKDDKNNAAVSAGAIAGYVIAGVVPLSCVILLLCLCAIFACLLLCIAVICIVLVLVAIVVIVVGIAASVAAGQFARRRRSTGLIEIPFSDLDLGAQLGAGSFGTVYLGRWRSTAVAVKVLDGSAVSKAEVTAFTAEVDMMMHLRHPNTVLLMGACTKPPKLAVVMEYLAFGSLYDLLHNTDVHDIPFAMRVKMAYGAARGVLFLHESGVVHRDLKTLNLLLDEKWGVKVSDFGLSTFKDKARGRDGQNVIGSLLWTAPEVLEGGECIEKSDVYSFGIILWEIITRLDPYEGMNPIAVVRGVTLEGLRPAIPEDCPKDWSLLVQDCWDSDLEVRPSFAEILQRLRVMLPEDEWDDSSSTGNVRKSPGANTGESDLSNSTSDINSDMVAEKGTRVAKAFARVSNSNNTSSTPGRTAHDSSSGSSAHLSRAEEKSPKGEVICAFVDVRYADKLWEAAPRAMCDAMVLFNKAVREESKKMQGYEVSLRDHGTIGGEGSFFFVFPTLVLALRFAQATNDALLHVEWPKDLEAIQETAVERDYNDKVIFKGLRARMGMHIGTPKRFTQAMTRRTEYSGPVVDLAARVASAAQPGQVLVSREIYMKTVNEDYGFELQLFGRADGLDGESVTLYCVLLHGTVATRVFKGGAIKMKTKDEEDDDDDDEDDEVDGEEGGSKKTKKSKKVKKREKKRREAELMKKKKSEDVGMRGGDDEENYVGGELMDTTAYLMSANMARWIIDYDRLQIGEQIGKGSFGCVYRAQWKGVAVAVKKMAKQKLSEQGMLEFRSEIATLASLSHPNIVLFVGASVRAPNLAIITEYMPDGSLRSALLNNRKQLPFGLRVSYLHQAAQGMVFIHSKRIIHRDLNAANLLIDGETCKIADFGFARMKAEQATMTNAGTPANCAPEVMLGQHYDELCDVYSFGILMWEVLTRSLPFEGSSVLEVTTAVTNGGRPKVPTKAPEWYVKLMTKAWSQEASSRPSFKKIESILEDHLLTPNAE